MKGPIPMAHLSSNATNTKLPADCADGSFFFHYDGGNKYHGYEGKGGPGQAAGYIEPSPGLEAYYGLLPGK